jgi:uncharacterized RDD family membrane protein YckC
MSSTGPEANRFAPPAAHVEDVESAASGQLAGRGIRLIAVIVDSLLAGVVFYLLAQFTPYNAFDPKEQSLWVVFGQNMLIGFAAFLLLHGWLLHVRGQTIGKALFRIKIVRSDGSKASLLRLAGLRYFASSLLALVPVVGWIYALADALLIFRDSRKCLHDNIADTIVIRA